MKTSLSKIRYLSKEILQGKEIMMLKTSQALLYKYQGSKVPNEDCSINKSVIRGDARRLVQSEMHISKFESCEFIEKIDNDLKVDELSKMIMNERKKDSHPINESIFVSELNNGRGNFSNNFEQNLNLNNNDFGGNGDNKNSEIRFNSQSQSNSEFKKSSQIEENLLESQANHFPFEYNKRFEVGTPVLSQKEQFQKSKHFSEIVGKLDSSRFNEFKKEFLEFENSSKNIEVADTDNPVSDPFRKRVADNLKSSQKFKDYSDLLSIVNEKPSSLNSLTSQNNHQNLIPSFQNMEDHTFNNRNDLRHVIQDSQRKLISRKDVFERPKEDRNISQFDSQPSLDNSESSKRSLVNRNQLKRYLNDPNNIFASKRPETLIEMPSVSSKIRSSHFESQDSTHQIKQQSKELQNKQNGNCHCHSQASIQININNNTTSQFRDNSEWSPEKQVRIKEAKTTTHTPGDITADSQADFQINFTKKLSHNISPFERDKKSVNNSIHGLNALQKVLNNKFQQLESKIVPNEDKR
jgi:hypothetical protein